MRSTTAAVVLFLGFAAFSCTRGKLRSTVEAGMEAHRVEMMELESAVSGRYFDRRNFHLPLMREITDSNAAPYPVLDSLFYGMRSYADSLILQRKRFDARVQDLRTSEGYGKRIRPGSDAWDMLVACENLAAVAPRRMNVLAAAFDQLDTSYTGVSERYGVRRFDQGELSEMVGLRLMSFQDSMEAQGSAIAFARRWLKETFPEQKGEAFWARYQPVSEMEAKFKIYQQLIIQLENSLSRIEEGNQEEFYYLGPTIRPRMEIMMLEDLYGKLILEMREFRELEDRFRTVSGL